MAAQEQLTERCLGVAALSKSAQDWVSDEENADRVGLQRKSLVNLLRKGARRSLKLARASQTKMSVSVFGPSQAGKSFLVSVLARPEGGRLVADFQGPGGRLDYIREINPEGEGESTGLVTRFTMTKEPCPDGFPIKLVLLSEADVVRTIINSFYMDGDQSEPAPEPQEIAAHIDRFRPKAGGETSGMSFEEVLEIADYVNSTFGRTAYASALRSFWDDAGLIAPGLPLRERAAFFDILWGGHAALTELYCRLGEALAKIQHAETVHAPLAALVPREHSIIDVKTLKNKLFVDGVQDDLPLRTRSGATVSLPRAVVCALAAELVLPMETRPSPIFEVTDLLDFPGARNRFKKPLDKQLAGLGKTLAGANMVIPELLLRGKVAYLFDRYVENQEITSMLLCVPDSNMETLDLPGLVDNWINLTHGTTPELRTKSNCVLFFVFTKFDKHLGESAAGGGEETRFERRIAASLREKFGRGKDDWVENWTPDEPFRNCYWLRNPNFFVEGLIDYDADRRELRIRQEKESRVAELRAGCLAAVGVQKHFANPQKAWDAALNLNDGGIDYLVEQLTRVCKPDSKLRQIRGQIDKVASDIAQALSAYHISDDIDKRIAEKESAAIDVMYEMEVALQRHRFGAMLASLMVDQDLVRDRISRVPSSIRISSAVSSASATSGGAERAAPGSARLRLPPRPGAAIALAEPAAAKAEPRAPAPGSNIRTMTQEAFQAETSIEVWIEGLDRFRDDVITVERFGLRPESVANVSAELAHAVRRVGLINDMKTQLRDMNFGLTIDKQAEPAAIVCAERINRFVITLGTENMHDKDKPTVELFDGEVRPVFQARTYSDSVDDLPLAPRAAAEDLWADWVFSLKAMFIANAKDSDAGQLNIEQNQRLGKILVNLQGGPR